MKHPRRHRAERSVHEELDRPEPQPFSERRRMRPHEVDDPVGILMPEHRVNAEPERSRLLDRAKHAKVVLVHHRVVDRRHAHLHRVLLRGEERRRRSVVRHPSLDQELRVFEEDALLPQDHASFRDDGQVRHRHRPRVGQARVAVFADQPHRVVGYRGRERRVVRVLGQVVPRAGDPRARRNLRRTPGDAADDLVERRDARQVELAFGPAPVEEMDVGVDEARNDRLPFQIDRPPGGRSLVERFDRSAGARHRSRHGARGVHRVDRPVREEQVGHAAGAGGAGSSLRTSSAAEAANWSLR